MTVENEIKEVEGLGNGSSTVFSFAPMVIYDPTHLAVYLVGADNMPTLIELGTGSTNYSVTVTALPGTGAVNYPASGATRLADGEKIVIKRNVPLLQLERLNNQGGYFPEVQEKALDLGAMADLQLQEQIDRAIKVPIGTRTDVDVTLPPPVAGESFAWNSDGTGFVSVPLEAAALGEALETAQDAATEALAASETATLRAADAAASAASAADSAANAAAVVAGDYLVITNNLSDVDDAAASRTNLGLTEAVVTTSLASQAEAEAGTDNTKLMTPLRTAQSITALATLAGNTGWVTVRDFTVSAGASNEIVIADASHGLLAASYDYRVKFYGLNRNSGGSAHIDAYLGTGTSVISWQSSGYDVGNYGVRGGVSGVQSGSNTSARFTLSDGNVLQVGTGASNGLYGELIIYSPRDNTIPTWMKGQFWHRGQQAGITWFAMNRSVQADSALKFVISANLFGATRIVFQKQPTA